MWSHPACCDEVLKEIVHACSLEGNTQLSDVKLRKDEETESGSVKPEVSLTKYVEYNYCTRVFRLKSICYKLVVILSLVQLLRCVVVKRGQRQANSSTHS